MLCAPHFKSFMVWVVDDVFGFLRCGYIYHDRMHMYEDVGTPNNEKIYKYSLILQRFSQFHQVSINDWYPSFGTGWVGSLDHYGA
jgi:hypothetical protein